MTKTFEKRVDARIFLKETLYKEIKSLRVKKIICIVGIRPKTYEICGDDFNIFDNILEEITLRLLPWCDCDYNIDTDSGYINSEDNSFRAYYRYII